MTHPLMFSILGVAVFVLSIKRYKLDFSRKEAIISSLFLFLFILIARLLIERG